LTDIRDTHHALIPGVILAERVVIVELFNRGKAQVADHHVIVDDGVIECARD